VGRIVAWVLFVAACRGDFDAITHAPDAASDAASDANGSAVTYPLVVTVTGAGQVTSAGGAIACPGTCSAELPAGTMVALTASTGLVGGFDGYSGDCAGATCTVAMTAPRAVGTAFSAKNIVFVTSTLSTPGNIGSLAAADAICTARAQAAALPGAYVAWLSSTVTSAKARLGSARGWVRVDGMPVADTVAV